MAARESVANDLGPLLASGQGADVTVVSGDCERRAHKAVLAARSPVLAARLEASEGRVHIEGVSEEVLTQLLQYMYWDEAPLLRSYAAQLLALAADYDMPGLKRQCERQLAEDLSVENAAATGVLSMVHSCGELTRASILFLRAHLKEIITTDGWAETLRNHGEVAINICRLVGAPKSLESSKAAEPVEEQRHSLEDDLERLLLSGQASDVTLVVDGSKLQAHRTVLSARSTMFARLLRESADGPVEVEGIGEDDLRQILFFLYTGRAPLLETQAVSLLAAADTCALEGLKQQCECVVSQ